MDELIEATINWMDDESAVDFATFIDNYRADMMARDVAPEQPSEFEEYEDFDIEFLDDINPTDEEFFAYVNK